MNLFISDASPGFFRTFGQYQTLAGKESLPRLLFSFWYAHGKRVGTGVSVMKTLRQYDVAPIMLDSGVFSARKSNVKIPSPLLAKFYQDNHDRIAWVMNMDTGDPEDELKNALFLKSAGVPVIPIIHGYTPREHIDEFFKISDYVAVSFFSFGGPQGDGVPRFLDKVFSVVRDYGEPTKRVHALGTEDPSLLLSWPFFSSDSSATMTEYAYFNFSKFTKMGTLATVGDMEQQEYRRVLNTRSKRIRHAIDQRAKLQKYITDVWTERGIVWESSP